MAHVQKEDGKIVAVFKQPQTDAKGKTVTTEIPDDSAEVEEFMERQNAAIKGTA